MEWIDIAGIVFVCVTMNHLGLIGVFEKTIGKIIPIEAKIPIVSCPKCCTFWVTLAYGCDTVTTYSDRSATKAVIMVLATSFLASYLAIWLELLEGYIDTLYMKLYEKIITTNNDDAPASDADSDYSAGTVSEL